MADTNPARDRVPTAQQLTYAAASVAYAAGSQLSRVAWLDGRIVQRGDSYVPTLDDTLAVDWFVVR
jgi:hypothetical protein